MAFRFFRRRPPVVTDEGNDRRFRVFAGRRHLVAMPYPLPKDMDEINRLDFQHYLLRNGFRGNFAAPVTAPASVLDVGCGSGRWAMEVASVFPAARVIGMDLIAPAVDDAQLLGNGLDRRPANYSFVAGNVLEGLPFPDASFDFVHQRLLITAIPRDRWPAVISELVRITRPGGWVELAECGVAEDGGPGYTGLWNSWIQMCAKRGVDFAMGHSIGDLLRTGGLGHVSQHALRFPMGTWGGHIGRMSATDCLAVGRALRAGVVGLGVLSEPEYDRLFALAQQEFAQPRGHGALPFYLAFGQRMA
jgi:ubiquinone/menaquinone biosynthesis C-methylase UbiE